MNQALKILDILLKIIERSDVFQHKQEAPLNELSLSEVHCIDYIGTIDHPNVTKISEKMGLSRAGVSKINKRLLGKGLIESYQETDNNKEIYFLLTESGQYIYNEHKKIHNEARKEWLFLFENYSDNEQTAILRFLADINDLFDSKWADKNEIEE